MPPLSNTVHARLFIAVEVPATISTVLERARNAFTAAGAPHLRWARPENIHLTLKFLGEVPVTRVNAIETALTEAAASAPHLLQLGSYGLFGGQKPHVLWIGLGGEVEETAACAERLGQALIVRGFPAAERPFNPHLTLARLPTRADAAERAALTAAVSIVEPPPPLPLRVATLSLIRSRLRPTGATYETLARQDLRPPSS